MTYGDLGDPGDLRGRQKLEVDIVVFLILIHIIIFILVFLNSFVFINVFVVPALSSGSRSRGFTVYVVWEVEPTANCSEGDREESEEVVTDDGDDFKEQRNDDGGMNDEVPTAISDGSIMNGG